MVAVSLNTGVVLVPLNELVVTWPPMSKLAKIGRSGTVDVCARAADAVARIKMTLRAMVLLILLILLIDLLI
jgi:hypothetical protein